MPKPIPFDVLEKEFKKAGYILIKVTEERKRKAYYICEKHIEEGEQITTLSNFKLRKSACRFCGYERTANAKRLNIDKVKNEFTKNNLRLLDDEYINEDSSLKFICNEHSNEIQTTTYRKLRDKKYACEYCKEENTPKTKIKSKTSKYSYEQVFNMFKQNNYILLDTEYKNNQIRMKCLCIFHPENVLLKSLGELKQNGHTCRKCKAEKSRLDENFVRNIFLQKGFILDDKYTNSNTPMKCHCIHHLEEDLYICYDNMRDDKHGCKFCSADRFKGENNPKWNGGISTLEEYVRSRLIDWKKQSMKVCNYKCVITGDKFDDIHHLYSFHLILEDVISQMKLSIHSRISDYSDFELQELIDKVLLKHKNYPLGVCLRKDVHLLFHKLYGQKNNTPEQFYEFKNRYLGGEFNDVA